MEAPCLYQSRSRKRPAEVPHATAINTEPDFFASYEDRVLERDGRTRPWYRRGDHGNGGCQPVGPTMREFIDRSLEPSRARRCCLSSSLISAAQMFGLLGMTPNTKVAGIRILPELTGKVCCELDAGFGITRCSDRPSSSGRGYRV
jgi:hypothetical protein